MELYQDMYYPEQTNQDSNILIAGKQEATLYSVYLDEEMGEPKQYRKVYQSLEMATEIDAFNIHINTIGGQLDTTIQLIAAIKETKAYVNGICYNAQSAGSIVLLSCPNIIVKPFSSMMIHSVLYGGGFSTVSQHEQYAKFSKDTMKDLFEDVYSGFLTDTELKEVINGEKEIWLKDKEIVERLEKRKEYLEHKGKMALPKVSKKKVASVAKKKVGKRKL